MNQKSPIYKYSGNDADVTWDKRLCIHIAECGRAACELFEGGRDPWCQPDLVNIQDVVDIVQRCPTGALSYEIKNDEQANESAPKQNAIVVSNHGPLYVHGQLDIDGAQDDMPGVAFRAALCRCGQSENKPFCDNTHEKIDFRDRGAVGETGDGLEQHGGTLTITRAPNGPLLINGNVQIIAASGRVAWEGTKVALCRCGGSNNKPFCDGQHKAIGFEAE